MHKFEKIFVLCPGGKVTGGPHLLHQLVDELRANGHAAFVSYYPFDAAFETPSAYAKYDCPQGKPQDLGTSMIIAPEVVARLLKNFSSAQTAIWWLSVDNYFGTTGDSLWRDAKSLAKRMINGNVRPLSSYRKHLHFVQSEYAGEYVRSASLQPIPLSDYLEIAHQASPIFDPTVRQDVIAYNPKKGVATTQSLIQANPALKFRPIQNMTAAEVAAFLSVAKIYIDFGNHPGKDRLPREAAMAGCCVITGRRGSARNPHDVAIPQTYKLDEKAASFQPAFSALVQSILNDFGTHQAAFAPYRTKIGNERAEFKCRVREIFGDVARSGCKPSAVTRRLTDFSHGAFLDRRSH
jgi:hypothetical protein